MRCIESRFVIQRIDFFFLFFFFDDFFFWGGGGGGGGGGSVCTFQPENFTGWSCEGANYQPNAVAYRQAKRAH